MEWIWSARCFFSSSFGSAFCSFQFSYLLFSDPLRIFTWLEGGRKERGTLGMIWNGIGWLVVLVSTLVPLAEQSIGLLGMAG